jgi:hypothetical protein
MKRGGPIQRKTPMPRGSLRSTPPAQGSGKPAKRKPPRYTGPNDKLRKAVLQRDDYTCQRCGREVSHLPYSLQHLLPRGRGGKNTMRNLVTVCGTATTPGMCHAFIEFEARLRCTREGWLIPMGYETAAWAVHRFGQLWSMPGESWVECEPHPDQVGYRQSA